MKMLRTPLTQSQNHILSTKQRKTHTHIIGQPGMGKSRLMESWIMQDIAAGKGVGVIDPHGELFNNLLCRIARRQSVWQKVIIIDPCNTKWAVNINPLKPMPGISSTRSAWFLTDIILKIWKIDATAAPRMTWLMANTFSALSELGLSLLELPQFLLDKNYRESRLIHLHNNHTRFYFQYEFPKSPRATHQWVTPLLNKIGGLLFDPDIQPMLAGGERIDFRQVMDEKCILLVHIPKGILGEGPSALLGAFIVAQIQKAALSRTNSNSRNPYYLYLDEFQNYTTDNIKDILSESRKYALSLILAHQYLRQLTPDIRSAVLNTSGTVLSFRVGYEDACRLAKVVFPSSDFKTVTKKSLMLKHFASLPYLALKERESKLGWEGFAQMLSGLRPREFWSRKRGSAKPIKCRSLEMPDPRKTRELKYQINALRETSGQRYAKLKYHIQRDQAHAPFTSFGVDHLSGTEPIWQLNKSPLWGE